MLATLARASALRRSTATIARFSSAAADAGDDLGLPLLPESGLVVPRKVGMVGAPLAFGQGLEGVDDGPRILRDQDLSGIVRELGWRFEDCGDVEVVRPSAGDPEAPSGKNAKHSYAVGLSCQRLAERVKAVADEGAFALTLGGDHSIAVGSLGGVLAARPGAGVLWVDAHADINTPDSSPSGNVHGMPVAFLMGLIEAASTPGYGWLDGFAPRLRPQDIVYVGLRQVDAGERRMLKKVGIRAYDMHAVDRLGVGKVMEEAMSHLTREGPRPLHLSFDIDACDPSIAASTGTTVPGGLNYREAHFICEELARSGLLSSMDMVEVNPKLGASADDAAKTAAVAAELIASALGRSVL